MPSAKFSGMATQFRRLAICFVWFLKSVWEWAISPKDSPASKLGLTVARTRTRTSGAKKWHMHALKSGLAPLCGKAVFLSNFPSQERQNVPRFSIVSWLGCLLHQIASWQFCPWRPAQHWLFPHFENLMLDTVSRKYHDDRMWDMSHTSTYLPNLTLWFPWPSVGQEWSIHTTLSSLPLMGAEWHSAKGAHRPSGGCLGRCYQQCSGPGEENIRKPHNSCLKLFYDVLCWHLNKHEKIWKAKENKTTLVCAFISGHQVPPRFY